MKRPFIAATVFVVAISTGLPFNRDALAEAPEYEEIEEDFDDWEGVDFTEDDFDEVLAIISAQYIDPEYDEHMAWVTATDYMLFTMKPVRTIMPEKYFRAQKKLKDAKFEKLDRDDPFVIVEKPKDDEIDVREMTDDQIRAEKEKLRNAVEEREKAWESIEFSRDEFRRVMEFVIEKEHSRPGFRESSLWIAAATGYLAALDPHTTIMSTKSWDENTKETEDSSFEGIGAILTTSRGKILIETPIEGQPADSSGIKAGDEIVEVDGRRVTGMPLTKVVNMIKGKQGTVVLLKIRRQGVARDLEMSIVRQHIEVRNVQWRLLKDHPDIGYLKLTGFVEGTSEKMDDAIHDLITKSRGGRLRGLIIDLRSNPGGLLDESVKIADAFLESGRIVAVNRPTDDDETYDAGPGMWEFPLVVLVNSNSASASEILASAVQDNGRGLVIGDRTFGKASVQTLVPPYPRMDYLVKVTIARYYSPSGRTIQVTGVVPDVDTPPEAGGKQPVGFREEDLMHHLTLIENKYTSPNEKLVGSLKKCVGRMGTAEAFAKANPKPTIKFDFQLATAIDYLECLWLNEEHNVSLGWKF